MTFTDLLLEYNARSDVQDDEGNTALHIACINVGTLRID